MKTNLWLVQLSLASFAHALENGVGKLPAMGWNSWNAFHCDIEESKFLNAAEKMVSLGLKDAGYEYVNIDDCWSNEYGRDNETGRLVPDFAKFPDGINGTAQKIHDMGLKIGIYSSAGSETCAGWPASINNEALDAQTWAEWGIDYLKYDNCNVPQNWTDVCRGCVPDTNRNDGGPFPNGTCAGVNDTWCPADYDYSKSLTAERYRIMRDALLATGRPILYSLCEWGEMGVETWGNETGNSWRSTQDISNNWARIKELLNENSFYMNSVNFWGHADPDMLEVGNGGITLQEARSHFALWAAMKSPLLIGTDLTNITQEYVDILKNKYLIAFNQDDTIGEPAMPYKWGTNPDWTFNQTFPAEYWSGKFKHGTLVLVLNPYEKTQKRDIVWGEIPGLHKHETYDVLDVWTGRFLGKHRGHIRVKIAPHDTAAIVVRKRHGRLPKFW